MSSPSPNPPEPAKQICRGRGARMIVCDVCDKSVGTVRTRATWDGHEIDLCAGCVRETRFPGGHPMTPESLPPLESDPALLDVRCSYCHEQWGKRHFCVMFWGTAVAWLGLIALVAYLVLR